MSVQREECPTKLVDLFVTSDQYGADDGGKMKLPLRTGTDGQTVPLREIRRVWLLGYMLSGIRTGAQVNTMGAPVVGNETDNTDFEALDFVIMHIDGLQGLIVSNNAHCNGALAVLNVCTHGLIDNTAYRESYTASQIYDTPQLVTEYTGGQMPTLRDLVVKLQTRRGNDAPMQRAHFWLRVECKR